MKYALSSRLIHWLMAALILFLLGLGIYMAHFLSKEAPNRLDIYNFHKTLGALVLGLILVRIVNRFIFKAPALPATMPKYEIILANLGHFALYILMIAVPLSGYLMSNLFGYPVHFFGTNLPNLVEANPELGMKIHDSHWIFAYILAAVIALHVAAVIKHKFFDKAENDVLKRMV